MLKTAAEIAVLRGVSRQSACTYLATNKIAPVGKKGQRDTYNTDKEPLKSYINNKDPSMPLTPAQDTLNKEEIKAEAEYEEYVNDLRSAEKTQAQVMTPLNYLTAKIAKPGQRPADLYYAKALKLAEKNQDAALYFKLAQMAAKENADEAVRLQMIKTEAAKEQIAVEKANRLILENSIRRGEFMDKEMVKLLFGRVYSVHTAVLQPLALKLSDAIDALPPGESRRGKINEIIDNEIFSALENIKRLLIDFVEEGNGVDEASDIKKK